MKKRFLDRAAALRGVEHGFTLMELLVAMVVLSILMAAASQVYLQHRRKAWEAQVRASVRHMAGAQNYFVFTEGAPTFTADLDDLYFSGYRWNEKSLRPYVALATTETFCVQVHSAHDASIVWHFSSTVGHPQPGPATPADCGDPEVLGLYIAGAPPEGAGRDGQLSGGGSGTGTPTAAIPDGSRAGRGGDSSTEEGEFGSGGSTDTGGSTTGTETGTGGSGTGTGAGTGSDDTTTTGSTPGYGTTDPTSGTVPPDSTGGGSSGDTSGGTSGGSTSADGCTGDGTGTGSTSGTNHPSGTDRDTENGGSGDQGGSGADPDGDENDGADKSGGDGGANTGDQDGNNGSGNDSDFEDDNQGPDREGTPTPGSGCP